MKLGGVYDEGWQADSTCLWYKTQLRTIMGLTIILLEKRLRRVKILSWSSYHDKTFTFRWDQDSHTLERSHTQSNNFVFICCYSSVIVSHHSSFPYFKNGRDFFFDQKNGRELIIITNIGYHYFKID